MVGYLSWQRHVEFVKLLGSTDVIKKNKTAERIGKGTQKSMEPFMAVKILKSIDSKVNAYI